MALGLVCFLPNSPLTSLSRNLHDYLLGVLLILECVVIGLVVGRVRSAGHDYSISGRILFLHLAVNCFERVSEQ